MCDLSQKCLALPLVWALGASGVSIRNVFATWCCAGTCVCHFLLSLHRIFESLLLQSGALVPPLLAQASHTCTTPAAVSPDTVVVSESVHPGGLDLLNNARRSFYEMCNGLTFPDRPEGEESSWEAAIKTNLCSVLQDVFSSTRPKAVWLQEVWPPSLETHRRLQDLLAAQAEEVETGSGLHQQNLADGAGQGERR